MGRDWPIANFRIECSWLPSLLPFLSSGKYQFLCLESGDFGVTFFPNVSSGHVYGVYSNTMDTCVYYSIEIWAKMIQKTWTLPLSITSPPAIGILSTLKHSWIQASLVRIAQSNFTSWIPIVVVVVIKIRLYNPISGKAAHGLTFWWICWNNDAYWAINTSKDDSSTFQALNAAIWTDAEACCVFVGRIKVTMMQ